ncbi:hypothetical protein BOX15_Mlig030718g1 [Macrostomum lignano]|uniref:C3H1-type domain-containing protein n=1 Tax=Macrostomum lignano TaxID=282301 RepID=A0A267E6B7_9PLAT|nr:hypothetical protein BOX15_Mlig030718g1 [Macrostomum lignano]
MSSLSPIAQNSSLATLSNVILSTSLPMMSSQASPQNLTGSVPLPPELDLATQGIGMPTVFVKPQHLNYLRDFRTQQCPLFANHKCTQHKPFTCFHWHFPNQRRRRPLRKADGTFTYSPDVYCDKYDETRGECPNADACPYLHRNAGDTERRYHLRYFKTGTCIHDTDARGHCSRNGAHCAFAHGANDLRVPVYDIREVQEAADCPVNLPASLEKERVLSEDPKWNDMGYVLANYKTEQCRKPPRMCRQGYACPFYHNAKDKRRGPHVHKYRSTPCPAVKSSDEWLDSSLCEQADDCQYCHTRTEQQFHPEIYKSTKCNDVMQQNYCPRGPFCAFAHEESEMNFGRNFMQDMGLLMLGAVQQQQSPQLPQLHLQQQQQPQQQQQQATGPAPLTLGRLISPSVWEQAAAVGGNRASGLHRAGQQQNQLASPSSAMLPELDDLDLSEHDSVGFVGASSSASFGGAGPGHASSSQGSDSFSPLPGFPSSSSGPIGIPGAKVHSSSSSSSAVGAAAAAATRHSPGFNPLTYVAADQQSAMQSSAEGPPPVGSLPFQTLFDSGAVTRGRVNSGGDRSSAASSTYAQSPILMSNSPFANPGMDLERLQFQHEIDRARDEAKRMRDAMQRAQKERDEAQQQLEAVRAQLRDISSIAEHSTGDLSRCSPGELEELKQRLHSHLQSVQQLTMQLPGVGLQQQQPQTQAQAQHQEPLQPPESTAEPAAAAAQAAPTSGASSTSSDVASCSVSTGGSSVSHVGSADSLGFVSSLATVEETSGDVTPNLAAPEAGDQQGSQFSFARDDREEAAEAAEAAETKKDPSVE